MRCEWEGRDNTRDQQQWQAKWGIWELLILRHNNDIHMSKPQMKQYLRPILILHRRALRLMKTK